ncbi:MULTISPECIES: hypothetical protein [unclassified Dolichospermum]|uniref:hypothetical protein n=1 Tax=unclassified Dolichospermum TaxID=2622029 RepID=UPI0014487B76|nr:MULTISPECIES: hypothetical protein [unclassified Dolichospermum]MBO1051640.1 hypothetical protein [Dolichospermum sp. DET73]MTJ19439.1 hypothetical protein [Dolichospermum sp. UHCC 0299]MTJ21463.1 hypothetical protein [Dolichospermum sp. UHCC 0352]MTJ40601.1 hypothetical protein [Dolichospermum sp. UHCC 0406]
MNSPGQLQAPPDVFITPLLELRDYYGSLAQEYQRLFIEARSQLDNVESLLSTWSYPHDNEQVEAAEEDSLLLLSSNQSSRVEYLDSLESEVPKSDSFKVDHSLSEVSNSGNFSFQRRHYVGKGEDVPMLAQYENMTRMEALKKLLREYVGTVCHIDFIVRSLYGNLESTIFKVVKGRVQSSLTQGRESGYWSAIPNEPGCYTLDVNSLGPIQGKGISRSIKSTKTNKHFTRPQMKVVPMLAQFDGQFLIDALTLFLEQNAGRIFNVNEIVNGIYGHLDAEEVREVKNKVLNELSRGHRTGRFVRVPNQIGLYTWDMNMIVQK